MITINIDCEYIELDSLLKFAKLVNSGGEAKHFIKDGFVKLNGEVETRRKKKIYKGDTVEFDGECIQVV